MSEEKIDGRDYDLVPTQDETTSGRQLPVPKYQQSPDVPKDFKALAEAIVDDLDEVAGNIGDIDMNQDGSLQDQIKDLSEQVLENTDNIGENDKDTDGTLKEQIDALDGKVEDNTTNINNNTGQIDQNKQDIEDNKNQIDQNTQDIADINDILADGVGETYELVQELDGIALKDSDGMYSGNVEFVAGDNIGIEYGGNDITISADPGVPLGGLDGEVLTKLSDESGDYGWMPSSGGGGGCCAASYSEERDCAADACEAQDLIESPILYTKQSRLLNPDNTISEPEVYINQAKTMEHLAKIVEKQAHIIAALADTATFSTETKAAVSELQTLMNKETHEIVPDAEPLEVSEE